MAKVLYITYDGLTDPLGRSQVLPYLQGCAARGHEITILSCEKRHRLRDGETEVASICGESRIEWHPLNYHKRPPILSTLYDSRAMIRAGKALHQKRGFDLVHCRSYVAAIAGLELKQRNGLPLLFDMRGFWPEEKVEGGAWSLRNPFYRAVYRYFKGLESQLLRESDHIIVLSEAGRRQLRGRPELQQHQGAISVIPCCVDFAHFRSSDALRRQSRNRFGFPDAAAVLVYVGSVGTWYMLGEMLDFYRCFAGSKSDGRFLFITMDEPETIRTAAKLRGIDPERMVITSASRGEVPQLLAAGDLGISFIQPVSSKIASSPTKMGEMLAMGIPLVANSGVGDVAEILRETGSGAVVEDFSEAAYEAALRQLQSLEGLDNEIRARARAILDLDSAIDSYASIYTQLANRGPAPS